MQHSLHDLTVNQFVRSLLALKGLLKKAQGFAKERGFDESQFLTVKLAPDMFPFVRQVQIVTDTAKGCAARLSGKTPPVFQDDEKSLNELIARVDRCVLYLREFNPEDFNEYKQKKVSFPWNPGVFLQGDDFVVSHAIPNFYFHMTTVYALLRSSGLPVGKNDFLGEQNWQKE